MQVDLHRDFNKAYSKLSIKQELHVKKVIALFKNNPYDAILKNHALHGKQKGRRSISAGGDLRIVLVEENNYEIVEMLNVGTHTQVY